MPSSPYAKVLMSIDSAAPVSGGRTVTGANVIQLSAQNTTGWFEQLWEIYEYPVGFACPAGWNNVNGVYMSNAVTPPSFLLPTNTTWGKFFIRLTVNGGLLDGVYSGTDAPQPLVDESCALSILSPRGLTDVGHFETNQFNVLEQFGELKKTLRVIETGLGAVGGAGTPGGTQGMMQYYNLGSFGGAPRVRTDGTYLAVGGTTGMASAGDMRVDQTFKLLGRNHLDTADITIVERYYMAGNPVYSDGDQLSFGSDAAGNVASMPNVSYLWAQDYVGLGLSGPPFNIAGISLVGPSSWGGSVASVQFFPNISLSMDSATPLGVAGAFGAGLGVFRLDYTTTPPSANVANALLIYAEAGNLKYRKPDGTIINIGTGSVGGLSGQLEWNNGGAFAGTSAITTDGTYLGFGTAPGAAGLTRFDVTAGATTLINIHTAAATDRALLQANGVASTWQLGTSATLDATIIGYSLILDTWTSLTLKQQGVTYGSFNKAATDFLAFGASPATVGTIRLTRPLATNVQQIFLGYNAANYNILWTGAGVYGSTMQWGDSGWVQQIDGYQIELNAFSAGVNIRGVGYLTIGTTAGASGDIRLSHDGVGTKTLISVADGATTLKLVEASATSWNFGSTSRYGAYQGYITSLYSIGGLGLQVDTAANVNIPTSLSIGSVSTVATSGAIRFANALAIKGRNALNTADFNMLTLDASNQVVVGDSGTLGQFNAYSLTLYSSTSATYIYGSGVQLARFDATNAAYIKLGASPSSTGTIMLANGLTINARNAANTADIQLIGTDASNNVIIGAASALTTNLAASVNIYPSTLVYLGVNNATYLAIDATYYVRAYQGVLTMGVGSTAATTGNLRMRSGDSIVFRDATNTVDVTGLAHTGATNQISIGVGANSIKHSAGMQGDGGAGFPFTFMVSAISFTASSATYTLSAAEYERPVVRFSGTGGVDKPVVFPRVDGAVWIVDNQSANNVVLKTSSASGFSLPSGQRGWVYCDGTDIRKVDTPV